MGGNGSGNGLVQIAYLHEEHISHSFFDSYDRMKDYDRAGAQRIVPQRLNIRCGTGRIVPSRNYAAQLFLDKTPHEWLLMVDTDMGFAPDTVDRLLEAADPAKRPVVGALCFALMVREFDGMGGFRCQIVPTLYKIGHTPEGHESFSYYGDYPDDTVCQVAGTGAAFLLVHRSAFEKVRAEHGDHWFDQMFASSGELVGEDLAFCLRLGAAGIPINVHTGVKTTHHKEFWLGEEDYLAEVGRLDTTLPDLPVHVHLAASFAALAANEHDHDGMLKFTQDLERYRQIIEATKPEVIVETGTHTGASARWFGALGVDVITIDVQPFKFVGSPVGMHAVTGDTADPAVAEKVRELVGGRRCMVSLDSDHSGPHVSKEIELYGPMVSPGCYLVIEDTIFGYGQPALRDQHGLAAMEGSPLDAVVEHLVDNPDWSRDVAIERLHPVSSNPAGYWLRNG